MLKLKRLTFDDQFSAFISKTKDFYKLGHENKQKFCVTNYKTNLISEKSTKTILVNGPWSMVNGQWTMVNQGI